MERLLATLDQRRRWLGMNYAVIAKRSGVSMPTVVRILSGKHPQAIFANVYAIANALGLSLDLREEIRGDELLERQARQKARRVTAMLQGTSGLEGQALGKAALDEM